MEYLKKTLIPAPTRLYNKTDEPFSYPPDPTNVSLPSKTTTLRGQTLRSEMRVVIVLLVVLVSYSPAGGSGEVSFYGSSHVSVRLQEARSSSDIYFRLRTRRSDSMLFLAAGRTDYCLLVLDAGRLKVHINLGAGETEIASEAPFLLNDMKWHAVNLTRRGSQLTIQVDHHLTKANLPTRFHELNIHFGVWLGGLAGFNEIFLGNLPSFRGCMSHITYNSEDVILRAKTQPGEINGVSWNCSEEFEALTSSPFSLDSSSSYVISRVAIPRQGTIVKVNVRPVHEEDGLIFYVSGMSSRPDYLALQLREGKPHFVAEMGSGPVHILSTTPIMDRMWHSITIQVSPALVSLTVDNGTWTAEPPARGGSRHLDVSELVYLGVEDSRRAKLRALGLIDQSFQGCIKDFSIEKKAYGLPEADVSRNITTGCLGSELDYCAPNSETNVSRGSNCRETAVNTTRRNSSSSSASPAAAGTRAPATSGSGTGNNINATTHSRENSTGTSRGGGGGGSSSNSLEVITVARDVIRIVTQTAMGELEIMRVSPIHVAEGDSVAITPRHLEITLDLTKFGIRDSGVLFKVSKPPQHGRLEVTTRAAGSSSSRSETFALLDVGAGRVRYYHNGAENSRDSIELVLRLVQNTGFLLPAYLQDERVITLPVEITAVNDPPEIRLVPGGVLRLAEGTKIRLIPEVITSLDPDTSAQELQFTVLPMEPQGGSLQGYLEISSEPGKPILSFTQADLEANRVWYVDQGLSSSKMALKVTDGSSVSPTSVLRIETFPLRIAPEVNNGLEVANVMGTTVFVTGSNLSFTSNAADQGLVIEYHVIKGPRAGSLQLKRTNGQWSNTEHFTQLDLTSKGLRYLLQRPSDIPTEDEFSFHVSLAEVKVPSEFRFRLRIVSLRLDQMGLNVLVLNGTTESVITTKQLEYRTFPFLTSDSVIKYTVVQAARYGFLSFRLASSGLEGKKDVSSSSAFPGPSSILSFTQADLAAKRVFFQFRLTPYSPMSDSFLFNVSASHLTDGPFRCQIHHSTRRRPAALTLKPLVTIEGGREFITSSVLRIKVADESPAASVLLFNVTSVPLHGVVGLLTESKTTAVSHFQASDLEKSLIFYQHDGSESSKDIIPLVAWNSAANFVMEVQLEVVVRGVNNHAPHKAPTASLHLHVVVGGSRRVTREVLDYVDEDWDSDRTQLKYTSVMLRNNGVYGSYGGGGSGQMGNMYDRTVSLTRPIFSWTQADIDAEKLVFTHEGSESKGFLHFWVTDSKFTMNGTLEISAGAPWVHIVNTTTLAGKRGSIERLTDESLRIDTNLDMEPESTAIRIVGGPQHGIIRMNGNIVQNFTLGDMRRGVVFYENQASVDTGRDSFRFQAVVKNGLAESEVTEFDIAIYPEAYWTPLTVGANESVFVQENSSAVISQASLQVVNPHIPATDIVYTLTRPPRHGYLAIDPKHSKEETDDYVTMWDQTVINDGRLRYVQSEPNKTVDSMHFDVTNGVRTLRDLRIDFIVIPTALLLASNPLVVNEGTSIILNLTHLHSAQNYFADKLSEVRITEGPKHGTLGMISRPKGLLQSFPYKALQDGKIIYTHDGTETLTDQFSVVAQTIGIDGSLSWSGKAGKSRSSSSLNPNARISSPFTIHVQILPSNDQVPKIVNNTGTWVWAGSTALITNTELAALDEDSDENQLVFYVVGTKGGFPALVTQPDTMLHNFTQDVLDNSQLIFNHKGEDMKGASFDFEVSDGLNEASKETFKISIRKPELVEYEGRVRLSVFPLTQAPLKPENLLVRSSDGREINFQSSGGPGIGQLLIERSENKFSPVSAFTQTDVNNGKIFYQHLKTFRGQRANDSIRFTATSRYADPLHNITVEMDISVSGAALGGLQRYVSIQPLSLKEGAQVSITNHNVNLSAVADFINIHHRGSSWRVGTPSLRVLLSEAPKSGWVAVDDGRKTTGDELSLALLSSGRLRYVHDDSETREDSVGLSLWLWTSGTNTSTWLLNLTLPVHIIPVNDQPFQISSPKGPILPVVQEHWRKLSRNDLLTSDPDTPPAHIVYEVSRISHGRFVLTEDPPLTPTKSSALSGSSIANPKDPDNFEKYSTVVQFTQADVDAGKVIFLHSGPLSPVYVSLRVSDGQFPASSVDLTIPVQALTLQSAQSQASPIRILQGNSVMTLSLMNLPVSTNGHLIRLTYNITRFPLHGKILLRDRVSNSILSPSSSLSLSTSSAHLPTNPHTLKSNAITFSHNDLVRGELGYVQTDLSVANDSFEVAAHYDLDSPREFNWQTNLPRQVSTSWLVNVVSVPLLKRVKEVRSFVKGFAVGGIIAPDESEFSASLGIRATLNLAVLDASPLAAVTGANPVYEILLPPKYGQLLKLPSQLSLNAFGSYAAGLRQDVEEKSSSRTRERRAYTSQNQSPMGRVVSRFSHEDIRRGSIIYSPSTEMISNEILSLRLTSSSSMADEFIFKVLAPGVQPALAIAKFNIRTHDSRYYDDKTHNQIISDGSTDPATKRSGGGAFRDLTHLVTPHMTKDSLITIGVVIAGVITLTLFLVVGIRCTCVKARRPPGNPNNSNNGGLNNGNSAGVDPKCNGIGIIDAYAGSTTCTLLDPSSACQSDSDCSHSHHHGAALRPLLISPLSPRSRHKVGTSRTTSDSGSWTSSGIRNEMPTPSVPQCRVTPLCSNLTGSGSDSGGYSGSGGGNSMMMCPLLPPTPICDTFAPLPEELDPPEPYGFTYGSITGSLPAPLDIRERDQLEDETPFADFLHTSNAVNGPMMPGSNAGTLRRNTQGKNQYWV